MRWLIAGLVAATAYCQDPQAAALSLRPPGTAYSDAMLDNLEKEAEQAIARIPRATTKSEVEQARPLLRKRLEHSLGLERLSNIPDTKPVVAGKLDRDGYRIEKIVFQTLPGLQAPADLYLPAELHDRAPAVLLYPGHSWATEGKSHRDAQTFGATMARMGFAVFIFHPIGQGERGPSPDDFKIPQMLLVGLSQPGIAEYEIRCALDYLSSRPEIDPHKIGMTGADGGGFMTWITAALDDRTAAAAIADDTEDFGEIIHRKRQTDWDQANDQRELIPGILQYANNHELLAMSAPRPLLIIANAEQSGQNASVRSIFDYGADIYGRFGANGKAQLVIDSDDGPGYQRQKRQAAYRFFLSALKGERDPQPIAENASEIFPPPDPSSQLSAKASIAAVIRSVAAKLPESGANIRIRDLALPWPSPDLYSYRVGAPGVFRYVYTARRGGYSIPWLFLFSGKGEWHGMLVAISDRGKESLVDDPIVREALKRNYAVASVDMRGIGELAGRPGWLFATNLLLGDNLAWKEAYDVLGLLDEWHEGQQSHSSGFYANGPVATLVASYAMSMRTGPAPEWIVLKGGVTTFRDLMDVQTTVEGKGNNQVPYWSVLFNGLSSVDLMRPFSDASTNDIHSWIIDPLDPSSIKANVPGKVKVTTIEDFLTSDW